MSIGYACLTVGVIGTNLRTCTLKNASTDVLADLIQANLQALDRIIDYNIRNNIKLFRISSDIIPFGSHSVNTMKWWEVFDDQLRKIGKKALANGIRLSMHPGQYTVLNSPDNGVIQRAVEDLRYHARFLDALGLGKEHKIILHIGGIYGDKIAAVKRFIQQYRNLDDNIKNRLVIENDDKQYKISDVLSISLSEGIPVVFDNLHNEVNPDHSNSEIGWLTKCARTWRVEDGPQKIHYSQQDMNKRPGSHSSTIEVEKFTQFYTEMNSRNIDIMCEVKDKNLSAIKCINATSAPKIERLEKEWGRYKYLVLEQAPNIYKEIRQLLKDKETYPVVEFYRLIDKAMQTPASPGTAVNAAQHVWGYVGGIADNKSKLSFEKEIHKVSMGGSTNLIKRLLWKLAMEQNREYLMDSLYFVNQM